MRRAVLVAVLLAGCTSPAAPGDDASPAARIFEVAITDIDPDRRATEPSLAVAPDGRIIVVGATGAKYRADNPMTIIDDADQGGVLQGGIWQSEDGGASWQWAGLGPSPYRNPWPGGGDSDVAFDAAGRAYVTDLSGASTSLMYSDDGQTWVEGTPYGSLLPKLDRPWVAAGPAGTAYHAVVQDGTGIWVHVTRDGGLTWSSQNVLPEDDPGCPCYSGVLAADGNMVVLGFHGPGSTRDTTLSYLLSIDAGHTWTRYDTPYGADRFGSLALAGGVVHNAWTVEQDSSVDVMYAANPADAQRWSSPLHLASAADARFTWTAASGEHAAVVWYERTDEWGVSGAWMEPTVARFEVATGLGEGDLDKERFGDFFEATWHDGHLLVAFNDASDGEARLKFARVLAGAA